MVINYELIAEDKKTGARAGLLHTPHGTFTDVHAGRNAGDGQDSNA